MTEGLVVGIDLGTTNSLVAFSFDDGVRTLANPLGDDLTPSAVAFEGDEVLVGAAARARAAIHPELTARSFKRDMGTDRVYEFAGRRFRPQELSALVLGALKGDAESALGSPVREAVITVPAYFNERQRQATREAGVIAGLEVHRLLNEPTAAAIAYGYHNLDRELRAVVLDLGGGTFDVTALEIIEGVIEIQGSAGDTALGGDDFTAALVDLVLARQPAEVSGALAADPVCRSRLRRACERVKVELSDMERAELVLVDLPVGGRLVDLEATLHREEAEAVWVPLLERMRAPALRAVRDARLDLAAVGEVLLVGGATRMPCVRRIAAELFQRVPMLHPEPDRVVAHGAALQAALKERGRSVDDLVVTDVASFSLGVATATPTGGHLLAGVFSPILERGTVLPVSRSQTYWTLADNQTEVLVEVFQGEHSLCRDNVRLGELKVTGIPPAPAAEESIEIRFSYDLNSLLEVEVTILGTGDKRSLLLEGSPGRLGAEEIEAARRAMERLKFHPRDALPNTTVLARAEALFVELKGAARTQLGESMAAFRGALESQDQQMIAFWRARLDELVRALR